MKKYILFILSLTTLTSSLQFNLIADDKIRIGIPLPLTGGLSANGTDLKNSFLIAKDYLRANNVEYVFEDDQCEAKQSVTIANKLINIDKVNVVSGIYCNNALLPAGPIYKRTGMPVITTGATTGDVKGIGKNIFRLFPADQIALEPLIPYITSRHNKLCMLTALDIYTELMQRSTKNQYAKLSSSKELFIEEVDPSVKDFRSVLLRLSKNNCSAYYLNPPSDDLFIIMYKQLKVLNPNAEVYAVYNPASSTVTKALGNALDGTIYSDLPSYTNLATPLGQEFNKAFKQKFGEFQTAQPLGLLALEALRLILKAKELGIPVDQYVRNRKITDGAMLPYSFDADGAIEGINFKLIKHQDGKTFEIR